MPTMRVNWKKSQPVRNTYKFKLKEREGLSVFKNTMTWMSSPTGVKSAQNLGHVYAHRAEICPESGARLCTPGRSMS